MQNAKAILRNARISPQKMRLVADLVRGKVVANALDILRFSNKKAATLLQKLVLSAVANAENNFNMDIDDLKIGTIYVDEGPVFKRLHARARGRANRITKRSSHVTVVLSNSGDLE